jgi:hypothetical protein
MAGSSPTTTGKSRGAAATKKMVVGMKELWTLAVKDFTENSRELKQDFVGMIEAAREKMPAGAPKEPKMPSSLLVHQAVNLDVGGELLSNFKEDWGLIHRRTEEASRVSVSLDGDLCEMHRGVQYTHTIISDCCKELKQLPEVVKAVETSREKVRELGQLLEKVEESIAEYARVRAKLEAVRKRESLKIQHERQRGRTERELQRLKDTLAGEKRLKEGVESEIETEKAAERQKTFNDMFQQQMADYRETGSIDRSIGAPIGTVQLEDVMIEDTDGTASLNEFLSDVDDVIEESHDVPHDSEEEKEEEPQGKEAEETSGETPRVELLSFGISFKHTLLVAQIIPLISTFTRHAVIYYIGLFCVTLHR